jgi:hypothetical protein
MKSFKKVTYSLIRKARGKAFLRDGDVELIYMALKALVKLTLSDTGHGSLDT